jgi:hypothetical protein
MFRKRAVVSVLAVCGAMSFPAAASDDQNPPGAQPPAATSEAPAPKKPDLSNWWQKSSMEYRPLPAQWLFHVDGTFSYMNSSGNTSGTILNVSANGDVRKSRFTSHSVAQLSRNIMVYGFTRSSVNYVERTLREQVDYDLTWYLKAVAGVEDYRNTLIFMDKRLNVYGGLGGTPFRNDKQQLALTAAIGHADFTFDRGQMMRVNPSQIGAIDTSPSSNGALGMQTWRWKVSPRFNFSEDASYMKYFLSALGYRWTINMSGNVPIDKRFSFNVSYRVKEETNSIIKALRVLPQDRTFLMGIKVSI